MKEIGIRELKTHASELVRRVAEEQATYTITRRGRSVGALTPLSFRVSGNSGKSRVSWDCLLALADRLEAQGGQQPSAVRELAAMRR